MFFSVCLCEYQTFLSLLLQMFVFFLLASIPQAEIGPGALNLTDSSAGASGSSSTQTGNTGGAPAPPTGVASGGRRPASPGPPGSRPSSKGAPGRGKSTWRVEDLEGELERKIKMLEKERQAMRKETHGQHETINKGIDTATHRVTELEHSECVGGSRGEKTDTRREVDNYISERMHL